MLYENSKGGTAAQQGYSMLWAFLISLSVYAGSMQFVLLTFFHAGFSLVEVALVTLTVNARQLFYGLSFLKSFPAMGKKRWYMMFSLTDETYSLLCAIPNKESREGKQLMFCISLFDQLYWIIGSVLGATIGSLLAFDTTGIDFAMTALFTVIFVEQWLAAKQHGAVYILYDIQERRSTPTENCISGECAAHGDHALSDCLLCTQYEFFSISVRSAGAAGNRECRTSSCVETQ